MEHDEPVDEKDIYGRVQAGSGELVKQPGAMVMHMARDLGIEQSVLRRRISQEHGGVMDMRPNKPLRSESASEVERLRREPRRVTTERDIQKKALGYFAMDLQ